MVRYVMSVTAEKLGEQVAMMQQVQASYEITDFSDAQVLDNKDQVVEKVRLYLKQGIPCGSVMLGAFDDLSIFSRDEKIRFISFGRMKQCLKIAQKLSIKTVLFYFSFIFLFKSSKSITPSIAKACKIPTDAAVPITVEIREDSTAMIRVCSSASSIEVLVVRLLYQSNEKSSKTHTLPPELNEKTIITATGAYKNKRITSILYKK